MPSSRKRNKGKERKAKQVAKKEETERANAKAFWRRFYGNTGCNHGCALSIPDDHALSSFFNQLFLHMKQVRTNEALKETYETHKEVWNNESYKKSAILALAHIGTNMLMTMPMEGYNSWPFCVGQAIVALEQYKNTDDIDVVLTKYTVVSKWRDLNTTSSHPIQLLKITTQFQRGHIKNK